MNILTLKNNFIAEGGNRKVYLHPKDVNKCIKIENKNGKIRKSNKTEYVELSKLSCNDFYAKNYGFVDTNLGKGIVFELIKNNDNSISLTLETFVKKYSITDTNLIDRLNEFKKYFFDIQIMIADLHSRNILVQMEQNCVKKLIICDGITAKKGIDVRKFMYIKLFKKLYIKRKFRKLNKELIKISN